MNPADIVVFLIIGLSGLFAFFKGGVREILSIGAWVAAVYITLLLRVPVDGWMSQYISPPLLSATVSILIVFIVSILAFSRLVNFIASKIEEGSSGALDRSLGLVFGLIRGLLIVGFVYTLIHLYSPKDTPEFLVDAKTLPMMEVSSSVLLALIPEKAKEKVNESIEGSLDAASEALDPIEMLRGAGSSVESAIDSSADTSGETGYNPAQRQQMDRLFNSLPELN